MQNKNNHTLMRSIIADEKYWFNLHRKLIKPRALDLADTIFLYLSQHNQYPEGLNVKISNNPNRNFDFCSDIHFTNPVTQLGTILNAISNIVDNLSEEYNKVTRIQVSLYYL